MPLELGNAVCGLLVFIYHDIESIFWLEEDSSQIMIDALWTSISQCRPPGDIGQCLKMVWGGHKSGGVTGT